jgi:hypothetical protein
MDIRITTFEMLCHEICYKDWEIQREMRHYSSGQRSFYILKGHISIPEYVVKYVPACMVSYPDLKIRNLFFTIILE